jgi:Fe-S cluster assembly ATP-binding protein
MSLLEINDLHATVGGKAILKGLTLSVGEGEVHAIMGPNGSGKSTLSYVLAGRAGYEVTSGTVLFRGDNLLELGAEKRAAAGIFLAMQYPVEIPGVTTINFLRTAVNEQAKSNGLKEVEAVDFLRRFREEREKLSMSDEMVKRAVNVGFSGGEKKRNEVLQMAILQPRLAILDETDSGLDIDALKLVSHGVNALRAPDRSFLVITHYQRLLDYIVPDRVHVLAGGRIVKSGGPDLARELEARGYDDVIRAA